MPKEKSEWEKEVIASAQEKRKVKQAKRIKYHHGKSNKNMYKDSAAIAATKEAE